MAEGTGARPTREPDMTTDATPASGRDLPPIEHGVRLFCEMCDQHQPFDIDPAVRTTQTVSGPREQGGPYWGEIACRVCHLVLNVYTSDHEGPHEFRPVARA